MAGRTTSKFAVTKVRLNEERTQVTQVDTRADTVAGEEPLEIRAGGQTITTTMRSTRRPSSPWRPWSTGWIRRSSGW